MSLESPHGGLASHPRVELRCPSGGSNNLGIFFAIFGAGALVVSIIASVNRSSTVGIVSGLVGLVLIFAGLFLITRAQKEEKAWEDFEFHFPEWSMPLGATHDVTVIRRSKKSIPDASHVTLPAELRCEEKVRYQVGTDTRTERESVVEDHLEVVGSVQDNTFTGLLTLPIPADRGGPTLDLNHNEINWLLRVEPAQLSTISTHMTIEIEVRPELDKGHRTIVDAPPPPSLRPFDA